MFRKCPKCGHVRPPSDASPVDSCPACGLVFRKYLQALAAVPVRPPDPDRSGPQAAAAGASESPLSRFLEAGEPLDPWRFWANAVLLALTLLFGWRFYFMDIPDWEMSATFLHSAMVPFHEFGHLLFRPLGEFMTLLGGSLTQVLIPLGFLLLFALKNRDNFTSALMLWWTGTQFLDIAPYIYDARTPRHVLLTGRTGDTGGHDFIDVLGDLGLLGRAHELAWGVHKFGLLVMLAAWAWSGLILYRQYQARSEQGAR